MTQIFSSLRFRLIILVLMAVFPAFGVILHSAAKHRTLTAEQVQRNALRVAHVIAAEQERYFQGAHQLLITLAGLPQVREKNTAACNKILAALLEPLYADLGVVDLKGNTVCSALRTGSSLPSNSASHFKRVVETTDFSIGDFRTNPSTGRTTVDLGYPVLDSSGFLRAIVFVALDLSWVTRITAETHLYPGASFTLVDSKGTVLIRYPESEGWVGKAISSGSSIAEGTTEVLGADGMQRLFAFSEARNRMGGQTMYTGIDIPAVLAFAEADRILVRDLITLGILSILALTATWLGADLFVIRRIRELVNATKEIAAGNLASRTRLPYGKSELGQLAQTFDDLAEALEKREAEAKDSAEHIQKQRQKQGALFEINLAITSTLDLSSILSALLEKMGPIFPYCAATVNWVNKQNGALEPIAHRNLDETEWHNAEGQIELGLPNIVLRCQSPLVVVDAQLDPRTTNPEFFRRHRLFSYVGLPMIAKRETLGVLSFYTKEVHPFSPEEMDFLTALANQAAIAVYNSRLYEQTRNQAAELETSNRIKDEFLGVMSHELRTPLNVIMNYAEALSSGMFGDMAPDQKRGTEKIKSQAGHLLALINGILEITKIETGTVTLLKEPIDLEDFVTEIRSDYMISMEKEVTLHWKVPPDLPMIVSDRMKLKQILTNLINNAIKFTEAGSVTISVQPLDQRQTVEFAVADTGPGISDELIPLIFDKFRQLDSTTTRSYSGAGLGLYIVKTFTELLEGKVSVRSTLGEGSTFTIRLPIGKANEAAPREAANFDARQEGLN